MTVSSHDADGSARTLWKVREADDLVAVWIGPTKNNNVNHKSSKCGSFMADVVKEEFCDLIVIEGF